MSKKPKTCPALEYIKLGLPDALMTAPHLCPGCKICRPKIYKCKKCNKMVNIDDIYTEEELGSLNQGELTKNLDKALKSMTFWSQKRVNS